MSADSFDQLCAALAGGDVAAMLETLTTELRRAGRYHELFDALLMRGRWQNGLPLVQLTTLDDLPEPKRTRLEQVYLESCREVGLLLMAEGKLREAWLYLRTLGDNALVAKELVRITPNQENAEELIEIALHEGVDVPLGFRLVLDYFGTCNAITLYEGIVMRRPRAEQQAAVALLVERVHRDLSANVRADVERQEGAEPPPSTLAELVANRDWLFGQYSYHLDTTHLASTVRYARVLQDPAALQLAYDLTAYGRRLHEQFQYGGETPFEEIHANHGLYFGALLGQDVPAAVEFFRQKAESQPATEVGPLPAEVYVELLARLGRYGEAAEASARLLPAEVRTTGFAPSLLELSERAGSYQALLEATRQRGDLVGFAAGLIQQHLKEQG